MLIIVIIYVTASPNLSVIKLIYSGCKFKLSNILLVNLVNSFKYSGILFTNPTILSTNCGNTNCINKYVIILAVI